jgi:PAS domain-containing protein
MHILIIADSPDDRASIRQMLLRGSDRPYRFTEADLGAAGVRACREAAGTPPDCVLLDYHLPDMDAPEVLTELRNGSAFPACPVVVLTGSEARGGSRVLRTDAHEYIGKGWLTPESLTHAIENAIERFELIAERSSAAKKLRESEAKTKALADELFAVMEAVPVITFLAHDPSCHSMSCSRATRHFLLLAEGVSSSMSAPDGEKPTHLRFIKDGRELEPEELPVQIAAATGRDVRDFALTVEFNDGTIRELFGDAVPLFDESGNVRGAAGSFTDITDRKEAEAELRKAHHRLQSVLNSITDGLAVLDKNWRYTYLSEQGARIIGMRREQLLGACVWEAFPHAQGTKFYEEYHRSVGSGLSVHFEEFYPEPLNSWLSATAIPPVKAWPFTFATSPTASGPRRRYERLRKNSNANPGSLTRRFRPSPISLTSLTGMDASSTPIRHF